METVSIWHWLIILIALGIAVLNVVWMIKILGKAGRSGWWVLLTFVPLVNVVALWVFAFSRWPSIDKMGTMQGTLSRAT